MAKPIEGTIFNDWIDFWDGVTGGADTILGHEGHDTIFGLGGGDVIFGGDHNDKLHGDAGDDLLFGGNGGDELHGGSGIDEANYSDSGTAVLISLATGAAIGGTATGDTFTSIEDLTGSNHNDWLVGNGEANVLAGLDGNDTLKGGGGADTLWGGDDTDTASYVDSPAGVSVSLISGMAGGGDATGDHLNSIENLIGSPHADTLVGNAGVNVLEGRDGIDTLKGWGGGDTLWGGDDNDFLYGMEGADTMHGEGGHDHLDGGPGGDTMSGGPGNDIYIVDQSNDVVNEAAGEGVDVVRTSTGWAMAPGSYIETLETVDATATTYLQLTGNAHSNAIIGNDGENLINGGAGLDQMTGNGGNDTYYVDNAGDSVHETGGEGFDWVRTTVSWTLTANADVERLSAMDPLGFNPINLTGNEASNEIIGNDGGNVIAGGGGHDELRGRGGHDTLTGGEGADSFRFDTQLGLAYNLDVITDFNVADDTIMLDDDIFSSALALGNIEDGELVIGAAALDVNDRIIYNSATGALFYDSDGSDGTPAIQFATLSAGLALTHLDFLVVA
jgi:Ca2+-binding RTX toxin-like protein